MSLPKKLILPYYGRFWDHYWWLLLLSYIWDFFFWANDWLTWMIEIPWWWDTSVMLWVNWLMVISSYILYLILLPIWGFHSLCLGCFLMLCQVLSHLVSPIAFRKPPRWFTLSRMVAFEHFYLVFLVRVIFYDSYHIITHLLMEF